MTTSFDIDVPRYRASTVVGLLTWQPNRKPTDYASLTLADGQYRRFGHWKVAVYIDGYRSIYHYGTWMMGIRPDGTIDYTSVGNGSVSDQGMMNRLFQALGSELYYSRKGGASIG